MRRLTRRLGQGHGHDRDERGAVAVVVALLMIPLLGFAAIGLDLSGLWWQKQQLQTGADAGALAIAQACGLGSCGATTATAQSFAADNSRSAASATVLAASGGTVKVRTDAVRQNVFARAIGVSTTAVHAEATARYGSPSGATAMLPLAFSYCEWNKQTHGSLPSGSTPYTIYLTKTSPAIAGTPDCTGPSNNTVPGGFGWLTVQSGTCTTRTSMGTVVASDPGNSVPSSCSTADFAGFQGKQVLLPLFDAYAGTGSNATYRVYGYAAFTVTGYFFGSQYKYPSSAPCSGNERCVRGYFVRFVSLDEAVTYSPSAPSLGASVVSLTP